MKHQLIPERLKNAREALGINKAEAARRLQLSDIGYIRYESGQRTPSIQTLTVIAQCFHTSVEYLTGESDMMCTSEITISKEKNELLYNLVLECENSDEATLNRFIKYFKELNKDEDS